MFLFCIYNYFIKFYINRKINIITKFYKNENIIIGKDNIKTYVPFFILSSRYTKEQKSSYKINKIVERRIIINLSLQWNSKLTKQLNEYF
ncbi:hypothetical protein PFNF135_01115 [Plasmodium falciparum NF135/5.C10]|uniref:Uncharacterized protein n=1 Tax=Plasmodium falciparum NF135/5.C10 TaxID=1036726 RepID=W4IM68_PLAFA|nr:hypothetical protein PFNF135_01115 [Plasmodium falciparum NF135/5.C10]